jgi:hypothetical protein
MRLVVRDGDVCVGDLEAFGEVEFWSSFRCDSQLPKFSISF